MFKSSDDLSKPRQCFSQAQRWSLGADHVLGVDLGRDMLGTTSHSSRVLGSL